MFYDIDIRITSTQSHIHETVDVESKEEAEILAHKMEKDSREAYFPVVEVSNSVGVSQKNFTYVQGATYLVGKYSKFKPAICTGSSHGWRKGEYDHQFKFLESGQYVNLKGAKPHARVISEPLCMKGEITEACDSCIAKFGCFTRRGKLE